jgi:hypothetical protein
VIDRGRRSAASSARRLVGAVTDAGGAAVIGTGIVSIGLALDQQPTLSRILLAIASVLWLGPFMLTVAIESLAVLAALRRSKVASPGSPLRPWPHSCSASAPTCSCWPGSTCDSCDSVARTIGSSAAR